MKLLKNGNRFFLALLLSSSFACQTTTPPAIPVYIHDGLGGADGHDANDPTDRYKAPSELQGWWMTDPASMAKFTAWCYRTDVNEVESILAKMRAGTPPSPTPSPVVK